MTNVNKIFLLKNFFVGCNNVRMAAINKVDTVVALGDGGSGAPSNRMLRRANKPKVRQRIDFLIFLGNLVFQVLAIHKRKPANHISSSTAASEASEAEGNNQIDLKDLGGYNHSNVSSKG